MAPQNSTFIHENANATSDLSPYSPILAPNLLENGSDVHDIKSISSQAIYIQDEKTEIPIWICGEPRFVSGITNTTTCNDIIKALIDDEVGNDGGIGHSNRNVAVSRDFHDYVITERWRDIEQALPGNTCILPIWNAWGVARNEVKLKVKINRNGAEPSCTTEPIEKKEKPQKGRKINMISKLIRRIIKQGEVIQDQLSNYREYSSSRHRSSKRYRKSKRTKRDDILNGFIQSPSNRPVHPKEECTDEEILLVLRTNDDDRDSGINMHHGFLKPISTRAISHGLDSISETISYDLPQESLRLPYPKLNKFAKHEFVSSTPHDSERRKRSVQFNVIRNEIVEATQVIEDLIKQQRYLVKHLSKKSDKYRAQNELYRTKAGLDVSIDEIQDNLATYGKEIIEDELDLYKIKQEIQHKCVILDNLKRMLCSKDTTRYESFRSNAAFNTCSAPRSFKIGAHTESQFVDNVFEFCDNNKSIIV